MQVRQVMTTDARFIPAGTTLDRVAATMHELDCGFLPVEDVISSDVLYCFEDDDVESAAESMQHKQVYRLVVLDGPKSKKFSGIVSLGDILRHERGDLAVKTAAAITHAA